MFEQKSKWMVWKNPDGSENRVWTVSETNQNFSIKINFIAGSPGSANNLARVTSLPETHATLPRTLHTFKSIAKMPWCNAECKRVLLCIWSTLVHDEVHLELDSDLRNEAPLKTFLSNVFTIGHASLHAEGKHCPESYLRIFHPEKVHFARDTLAGPCVVP